MSDIAPGSTYKPPDQAVKAKTVKAIADAWTYDFQSFFEELAEQTGLTVKEAMEFYNTLQLKATADGIGYLNKRLYGGEEEKKKEGEG